MPISIDIPGCDALRLDHLVLDLNGTLALDGSLLPGVKQAVDELSSQMTCHLVTADTFGTAGGLFGPSVNLALIQPGDEGEQKAEIVGRLGGHKVAALGNGANDVLMLRAAALGIAVLGDEGVHPGVLSAADVVVPGPVQGLNLLLKTGRLRATLRN